MNFKNFLRVPGRGIAELEVALMLALRKCSNSGA